VLTGRQNHMTTIFVFSMFLCICSYISFVWNYVYACKSVL